MIFLRESGRVGQKVLLELRRRLFVHFQKLDVRFHDRYTTGRVVSRLTNDIDAIMELLAGGFDGLVTAVLTMVGVGVLLLTMDFKLGAVCLIGFPVLMLLVRWFSRASSLTYRRVRETSALVIVQFIETMTGIRAVQAYRREPRNAEIFSDVAHRYQDANVKSFRLVAIFMPGVRLVGNVTIGIVLLYGGWRRDAGRDDHRRADRVPALPADVLRADAGDQPVLQHLPVGVRGPGEAVRRAGGGSDRARAGAPGAAAARARRRSGFDGVHFSYVPERTVLPGLDLSPAGRADGGPGGHHRRGQDDHREADVAVLRPDRRSRCCSTGSTCVELSDADLRRAVVMVTQENFMFDGTIGSNIGFGKPGASQDEVEEAARAVGAHEFITALPEGYGTDVGKRGARLSAGQKQLVAFARAFLADPAVLILDEATSSLDVPSERLVQQALRTILADRTAVIIAHRLSHRGDRRPGARAGARSGDRGRHPGRPGGRRRRALRRRCTGPGGTRWPEVPARVSPAGSGRT